MRIFNKKILAILLILFVAGFATWFIYQYKQKQELKNIVEKPSEDKQQNLNSTTTAPTLKIYRNEEFGFEFQYPIDWKIIENPYRSPFSRFNLIIVPEEGKYLPDPILINIVVPDFADRQFSDLHGTIVQVGGISGTRYEFTDSGLSEIAIILPFGENKIILGANKEYQNVYDQFLASFKSLNK